ncbi:hypothetical protein KY495_21980 [Massilia sp. PAMC28688]|uniref:hypothetical protein n=1 Tax=Massilia sp. PAMC28688 TaxID=2861283 RepID=UPI001C62763C|nr:hypothetical protein [Massilia sp. PAMC28688]QYF93313.1 hypothetical protein KY495_21980 [Massilia sp. PAMC28688]
MRKYWLTISTRIDALSLRERVMLFAMAAGLVIFAVFFFFLNPHYARQKLMLQTMTQQQEVIAGIEAEITQTMVAHTTDPDAAERARLARLQADAMALTESLMTMQRGMVPAERMTGVLEQILRNQRNLRLTSMRTLPAVEAAPAVATAVTAGAAPAKAPAQMLHRHGVEVVVQGSYADMVAYMAALEAMQGQLFWGSANLQVESYPTATLKLVVYTVNLDKKWLKL